MWLILAILAVPLIEIGLFIQLGGMIGLWPTLIWVVLSAALGLVVLKGVASLGPVSLSRDMTEMRDPLSPMAHRLLVAIGGGLLVIPGFLTDALGLMLLVPPLRAVILRRIGRRLERLHDQVVQGRAAQEQAIIDGDWQEVDPPAGRATDPAEQNRTRH